MSGIKRGFVFKLGVAFLLEIISTKCEKKNYMYYIHTLDLHFGKNKRCAEKKIAGAETLKSLVSIRETYRN